MLAVCSQKWSRHQCISQACQGLHASYTPNKHLSNPLCHKKGFPPNIYIIWVSIYTCIYKTWQAARSVSIVGRLLNPTTYQDLMKQAVKMCVRSAVSVTWHIDIDSVYQLNAISVFDVGVLLIFIIFFNWNQIGQDIIHYKF